MKRPRLNALRVFEAAGRHLSFSIAGEELGVSQAAVSQQIRQLEGYLNARLFDRRNRGLELTSLGEAYHLAVHEALERLDTITDQLFPSARNRVVTVQCTPSVARLWLIPRRAALRAAYPEIELRIETVVPERRKPHPALIDFEILPLDAQDAGANCRRLLTAQIAPACAPSVLGTARLSTPADVLQCELLHVIGYSDDWHRWFRGVGLSSQKIPRGISFDGLLTALEAAVNGDGIVLGRRPFIDAYLESGDLVLPFGDDHTLTTTYYLRWSGMARLRRDATAVMDWLVETSAEP